jgi:orotidine-5'-phosphate decarboxylase
MLDLAESACIDGVVCSPHELELVSKRESLLSITPGIRLDESNDDQKRVMTPKEAINLGADYLVIGRPITSSNNIKESLSKIIESLK